MTAGSECPIHSGVALAANIKVLRERRKLKQRDCAKKMGVAQSTWCDWESGKMAPRYGRLPGIAKLLGVAVARLLT